MATHPQNLALICFKHDFWEKGFYKWRTVDERPRHGISCTDTGRAKEQLMPLVNTWTSQAKY